MKDPHPANITGEKTVSHVIEHTIRWDYIAIAAVGLFLAWKLGQAFGGSEEVEEPVGEIVEVEDGENRENVLVSGLGTEV
jgi:hypothetical protein